MKDTRKLGIKKQTNKQTKNKNTNKNKNKNKNKTKQKNKSKNKNKNKKPTNTFYTRCERLHKYWHRAETKEIEETL